MLYRALLTALLLIAMSSGVFAQNAIGGPAANSYGPNSYAAGSFSRSLGAGRPFIANGPDYRSGVYGTLRGSRAAASPPTVNAPPLYDRLGNYLGRAGTGTDGSNPVSGRIGPRASPYAPDSISKKFGPPRPIEPYSPNRPFGTSIRVYGGR
jgi:hypothetical protein